MNNKQSKCLGCGTNFPKRDGAPIDMVLLLNQVQLTLFGISEIFLDAGYREKAES